MLKSLRTNGSHFCPNEVNYLSNTHMNKPISYKSFLGTLTAPEPPEAWPAALQALWWDAKGDWGASHTIAQDIPGSTGNWIHAYLHRKEGDNWNAEYWYRRAKREFPKESLDEEQKVLIKWLLSDEKDL